MKQSPRGGGSSEIQSIFKSLKLGVGKWPLDTFDIENQCVSLVDDVFQVSPFL